MRGLCPSTALVGPLFLLLVLAAPPIPAQAVCSAPGVSCAVDFGGTDAYVTFGSTSDLGSETFTLETWFRRDGAGSGASTGTGGVTAVPLVTKGRGEADGSTLDMNYFLGIRTSDGVLVADFEEGAGGSSPGLNHPVAGVTPVPMGTWTHAAATYDGSVWRLYLNGMLDATLSVGQPARSDSIQHAALGSALTSTGAASGFFDGALDEARVWNVARSQADIQSTMGVTVSSASGLVARWGLDEGGGIVVNDSAAPPQDGTVNGSNWQWIDGSPLTVDLAPDQPALNAPADGAGGVATTALLDVDVSDPEGAPLAVTFWGRPAVDAPDFTVIALPDTQYYVSSLNGGLPAMFTAQTQWIVDNKDALNIVYVAHLGDCTENGNVTSEWTNADASVSLLENPLTTMLADGIPYSITVGNHDQAPSGDPNGTAVYNQWFGVSRFQGRGYYGGHYGTDNDNHYELFSASGLDFVVINLEYDTTPDAPVLAWAESILQAYPARRGIVVSHYLIGTGNPGAFGTQGQAIYDALRDNPNLTLMLAGHVPGEGRRTDVFGGNNVHTLMSDYQGRTGGGNGWLRIMRFSPANGTISVQTYSPWLNQYETDADSQFTVSYPMGLPFTPIGTASGVPSGSNATASWAGLDPGTEYDWYVTVSDGSNTTTGPVWSFTTGACGPDGSACDDGLYCNGADTCAGGACTVHAGDPCPGPDDDANCTESCNEGTDSCNGPDPVGSPCDDGAFCNGADTCSGGTCVLHTGDPCAGGGECADACNEAADTCLAPAGTPCASDGNGCTDDVCDGAGGCGIDNAGPCDDGTFCNGADSCSGGACALHAGNPCTGGGECADACNEAVDNCFDPPATPCTTDGNACTNDQCDGAGTCAHPANTAPCDDGLFCTVNDVCTGGNCSGTARDCSASSDQCRTGTCDETLDACTGPPKPDGTACDDGDACTSAETCTAGSCGGGSGVVCAACETCDPGVGCQLGPRPACTASLTPLVSKLLIKDATSDLVSWRLRRGPALAPGALGDPVGTDGYTLCVFDQAGTNLALRLAVPPGGTCGTLPCWRALSAGFRYSDRTGAALGTQKILLKSTASQSSAMVKGKGANLPALGLPLTLPVVTQLQGANGVCFQTTHSAATRNDGSQFKSKDD